MKSYLKHRKFIQVIRLIVIVIMLFSTFMSPVGAQQKKIAAESAKMELYPGLTGQQLLDSLTTNYKTSTVLSYNVARDTLYGRIFNVNDSLSGVYSLYTVYIDPALDPSSDAFAKGINAEHTWPQSKGASSGNPRSDMHSLRPARVQVNSARSNFPFGEIDDADTDSWFRRDQELNSMPGALIDEYTEADNDGNLFEPRESYKGDVARIMFYFYTMYRTEADNADPNFFDIQKDAFLDWHRQDPPDSTEIARTDSIAHWQDGLVNPFIVDTSLVDRSYFSNATTAAPSPLNLTAIGPDTLELTWSLPIGYDNADNELLLLAQEGSIIDDDPSSMGVSSYTANSTFGAGSEIGSGSFAMYKGDGNSVVIRGLTNGTVYHFALWNTLTNTMYSGTPTRNNATTGSGGNPGSGDIIISEIMKNPAVVSDTDGEWFELFNATGFPIDINGWTIKDDDIDSHVITNGSALIVPAQGFMTLGRNSNFAANGGVNIDYQYSSYFLANGADEIVLISIDGTTVIDSVDYDGSVQSSGTSGASMFFTGSASDDNNNLSFWQSAAIAWPSSNGDLGSPGFGGSDQVLPVQLSAFTAKILSNGASEICWTTESEINNVGFILSRAVNAAGPFQVLADYTTAAELVGAGHSNNRLSYCYADATPVASIENWYRLQAVDVQGTISSFPAVKLTQNSDETTLDGFVLFPAYPNPFNGQNTLRFAMSNDAEVAVVLFNALGQRVRTLFDGRLSSGEHSLQWNGLDDQGSLVGSGHYFYRVVTETNTVVQSIVLQR